MQYTSDPFFNFMFRKELSSFKLNRIHFLRDASRNINLNKNNTNTKNLNKKVKIFYTKNTQVKILIQKVIIK